MNSAQLLLLRKELYWFREATGLPACQLPIEQRANQIILLNRLLMWFRRVAVEIMTCPTDLWDEEGENDVGK